MRLAAIDLGSNSFRLEVGQVDGETLSTEIYLKEGVRLAAGLDANGCLTEEIQEKALLVLARFRDHITGIPLHQIRAVGTQTLRSAKNAKEFLDRAQNTLGCPIEILSGQEEARLVFKGCSHSLPTSEEIRLIVDIGGASTELVAGKHYEATCCESFHVGCVNTTVEHFKNGELSPQAFESAYLAAMAEFNEARWQYKKHRWEKAYGSSGSMEALCSLCNHTQANSETFVTRNHLIALKDKLLEKGFVDALDIPGLPESRKGVIAGGLAVLLAVFDSLGIQEMYFAPGALRRGVLYALKERLNGFDLREKSLRILLCQTKTDSDRARRFAQNALYFYKQLESEVSPILEQRLYWAGMTSEIGKVISPNRYHHHGAYLLKNSHLPGFSKTEQDWIADLVLGHRGRLYKVQSQLNNGQWAHALLAMRLTYLLSHECDAQNFEKIQLKSFAKKHWVVKIKDSVWLSKHPLTFFLLKNEVNVWKALEYKLELEIQ